MGLGAGVFAPLASHDARELLPRAVDGERGACVEADRAERVVGEARALGLAKQIEHRQQVRALGRRIPRPTRRAERAAGARADVALGDEGREDRAVLGDAACLGLEHDAREPRVQREREHMRRAAGGDAPCASIAPEAREERRSAARTAVSGGSLEARAGCLASRPSAARPARAALPAARSSRRISGTSCSGRASKSLFV